MGFDTSGGGGEGGGGSIFDDPQFMQNLQGVLAQQPQGGGQEDPWAQGGEAVYRKKRFMDRGYDPDFGDPRRGQGLGGAPELLKYHTMGGGGPVSAPDGSVSYAGGATSPFEVGPSSGAPNTLHAAQQPGGGGYGRFPEMGMMGGGDLRGGGGGRARGGGWYGGYEPAGRLDVRERPGAGGNAQGGGQQQWYRPQGSDRPAPDNPGAAYDAGPGRAEARDEAAGMPQSRPAPSRWQMPPGGAYGRPQPRQRRRFYGNTGAIQGPQGSPGGAPQGGGY